MNQTVSFLFDYASPWAYLADELLEHELAGIPIDFQPVYLRGFESFSKGVPFTPAKLAYIGRDFARCTEHRGVAVCQPSVFPINGLHALRGALAAQQMGQFGEFHRAAFHAAWVEDRNISSAEVVLDLAAELGFDRADFSARVASAEVKGELRRLTENAIERGAFGVPSFLVGEELFWGHDRMDYVRRAACGGSPLAAALPEILTTRVPASKHREGPVGGSTSGGSGRRRSGSPHRKPRAFNLVLRLPIGRQRFGERAAPARPGRVISQERVVRDPEHESGLPTPGADHLPVRKDIDLLATIEQADAAGSFASKSFGNIIELGDKSLILECNREFETATPIRLSLVFPGQPRGDNPFARLHCMVRKVHDWPNLHFDVEIVDMDEDTRRRLELYLSQQSPRTGTPAGGGRS